MIRIETPPSLTQIPQAEQAEVLRRYLYRAAAALETELNLALEQKNAEKEE